MHSVRYGRSVLFDLERDPEEKNDRCASDTARCDELRARLQTWVNAQLEYHSSRASKATSFAPVVGE